MMTSNFINVSTKDQPNPLEAQQVLDRYNQLESKKKRVLAEYVWIGGTGNDLRSKTKVLDYVPESVKDLPKWNFDGSSTKQAPGHDSEVILQPAALFPDPFRRGDNVLVLCDLYDPKGNPIPNNNRAAAAKLFSRKEVKEQKPWYGLEQEYTFYWNGRPMGWPQHGFPAPQGPYYCGVGASAAFGRAVVEAHLRACLYAGITVSGTNAEVMPGQWEFQVGPCEGIDCGDHLWMARFLMIRVAEDFGVSVSFDPKPVEGDWNGAGCHANFSTKAMREDGGHVAIMDCVEKMKQNHALFIKLYGEGNEKRLTGRHETASYTKFSAGFADRGASVRIGNETKDNKKGYLEDRRPSSNCDPYVVSRLLAKVACVPGEKLEGAEDVEEVQTEDIDWGEWAQIADSKEDKA